MQDDERLTKYCEVCGSAIQPRKRRGEQPQSKISKTYQARRYCSQYCSKLGSRKGVKARTCQVCGDPIAQTTKDGRRVKPHEYAKYRYCTRCRGAARAAGRIKTLKRQLEDPPIRAKSGAPQTSMRTCPHCKQSWTKIRHHPSVIVLICARCHITNQISRIGLS